MVAEFQSVSKTSRKPSDLALFNQAAFVRLNSSALNEFDRRKLRHQIAHRNEGLVVREAARASQNLPETLDELILVGRMGLAKAIKDFDVSKGYAFSSYAVRCIRGAIQHYMRDRHRMVRIPQTIQEIRQRIDRIERIYKQNGINLSRLEIAQNLHKGDNITLEDLEQIERATSREYITSLDIENEDGPNFQIESWYTDDEALLSDALKASMDKLKHSEYVCIRGVFWQGMSHEDIAADYGWAVEQVGVYLERAIAKLKSELGDWA